MQNPWKPIYKLCVLLISKNTEDLKFTFLITQLENLFFYFKKSVFFKDFRTSLQFYRQYILYISEVLKLSRNEEIRRLANYL